MFFSRWTRHYFVLAEGCLYYFRGDSPESADAGPFGVVDVDITKVYEMRIQITATDGSMQFAKFERKKIRVVSAVTTIWLRPASLMLSDRWFYSLRTSRMFARCTGGRP
jgi:hypothetical protein